MKLLKLLWRKWLPIAKVIGNFQAQVILTIFYFVVISPLGFIFRFVADPLQMKQKRRRTNFEKWEHASETIELARKQY